MHAMMFEEVSEANSQFIHLTDSHGHAEPALWSIGKGTRAIVWAVHAYAKQRGCRACRVQYAVRPYSAMEGGNLRRRDIVNAMQPKGA